MRELLKKDGVKWAELLELSAKWYQTEYPAKENEKLSDVKGRIGSVIDLMKKEGEVTVENGVARLVAPTTVRSAEEDATAVATESTPTVAILEEKPAQEQTAVVVAPETKPAPVYDLTGIFDRKKPTAEAKKEKPAEVKETVEKVAKEKQSEEKTNEKDRAEVGEKGREERTEKTCGETGYACAYDDRRQRENRPAERGIFETAPPYEWGIL